MKIRDIIGDSSFIAEGAYLLSYKIVVNDKFIGRWKPGYSVVDKHAAVLELIKNTNVRKQFPIEVWSDAAADSDELATEEKCGDIRVENSFFDSWEEIKNAPKVVRQRATKPKFKKFYTKHKNMVKAQEEFKTAFLNLIIDPIEDIAVKTERGDDDLIGDGNDTESDYLVEALDHSSLL